MHRSARTWLWLTAAVLIFSVIALVLWPDPKTTNPASEQDPGAVANMPSPEESALAEAGPSAMKSEPAAEEMPSDGARVLEEKFDENTEPALVIPPGYGAVRLQVIDAQTGLGIAGIRVHSSPKYSFALAGGPWYRRTDADGWLDIPVAVGKDGSLHAGGDRESRFPSTTVAEELPPGLRYESNSISVPSAVEGEIQELRLELPPQQLYSWLRVVDAQTGLAPAGVTLTSDGFPCASLRDDGLWQVALLPTAKRHGVKVKAPGYGESVVQAGSWPTIPSQAILVELSAPGFLDLTLLDDGKPLEEATVHLARGGEQLEFFTDDRGEVQVELGASPPTYALRVERGPGRIDDLGDLFIEAGRRHERVHDLGRKATVTGYVRTANGTGVAHAWVAMRPLNGAFRGANVETEADGSFTKAGLLEGEYQVVSGYVTEQGERFRSAPQRIHVSREASKPLDLRPQRELGFGLRCRFAAENPLHLTFSATDASFRSGSLGVIQSGEVAQLGGYLEGDRVHVRVESHDRQWVLAQPLDITVTAGAIFDVDLELAKSTRGVVVDESGQPVRAEILARVSEQGGRESRVLRSASDGSFEVTGLGTADHYLVARSFDGRIGTLHLPASQLGSDQPVRIVVSPAAWLRVHTAGRVRRMELDVWSGGQSVAHAYLDVETVDLLVPSGQLRLVVTEGGREVEERNIEARAGASESVKLKN